MKIIRWGLLVIFGCLATAASRQVLAQNIATQTPTRYSLRTILPYSLSRIGSEALPVKVTGAGGGKLGPNEKFRIHVSMMKNEAAKTVTAIKISSFIFKFSDEDELVETLQTDLKQLELKAGERRMVDILVGYVDDIPLLCDNPGQEFSLEMAVTEVSFR